MACDECDPTLRDLTVDRMLREAEKNLRVAMVGVDRDGQAIRLRVADGYMHLAELLRG